MTQVLAKYNQQLKTASQYIKKMLDNFKYLPTCEFIWLILKKVKHVQTEVLAKYNQQFKNVTQIRNYYEYF